MKIILTFLAAAAAYRLPTTRRETLQHAVALAATSGVAPAFALGTAVPDSALTGAADTALPTGAGAVKKLTQPQVNGKLSKIPVVALVNEEDAPFLTGGNGGIGYFFLDPQEAFRELKLLQKSGSPNARLKVVTLPEVYFNLVRGDSRELGGELRLRPSRRQIVLANRALSTQPQKGSFLPTTLDEGKGQVPIFYSELVAYESQDGSTQSFPFFLAKEDLDQASEKAPTTPSLASLLQPCSHFCSLARPGVRRAPEADRRRRATDRRRREHGQGQWRERWHPHRPRAHRDTRRPR